MEGMERAAEGAEGTVEEMSEKEPRETSCGGRLWSGGFLALVAAQVVSLFGNAVLRFALPLYVLNLTGSAAAMGTVMACAWVPYIVLTPIGGVAADRVRKQRIMAALDTAMAAVCIAYLALDDAVDVVGLSIVALMALYAVQSIYQPTVQSAVPSLVPRGRIQQATAVISQVSMLSSLLGPVLGGLVFGLFGIEPVVTVAGVLFAASTVLILAVVRIPHVAMPRSGGVVETVVGDLRDAASFLGEGNPLILRMIVLATAFNLVLSSFVVIATPVVITEVLGLSNQLMGFAEGALALGGLAGGATAGALANRLDLRKGPAALAVGTAALALVAAAVAAPVPAMASYAVIVAALFVTMACCTLFSVQAISYVQGATPQHLIGKVMGLTVGLANCASPVGQLVYGWVFDAFRGEIPLVTLAVVAISLLLVAAIAAMVRTRLREK